MITSISTMPQFAMKGKLRSDAAGLAKNMGFGQAGRRPGGNLGIGGEIVAIMSEDVCSGIQKSLSLA